ncbi:GGDEF domain-containing protein [Oceanimonas pelagia]|uniref:diguanylate cyclase n=1 Tax=Oceanimonas pelagia TaxID=3028314 RepID=A0AA50KP49_9GAMM|nr:GGDEF domain-containing protein [Oceanimonas pelagia]WMC11430.1 GGDEF domain-containing protein [Oceanimonas pelagia]
MNKNSDPMMLQDLVAVITELQTLLNGLPDQAARDPALPEQADGRGLLVQWQKLFGSQPSPDAPAGEPAEPGLADSLHRQLSRLRRFHHQAAHQQQQGGEQLLQAARELQASPYAPPQLPALVHDLETPGNFFYYLWPLLECYQQAIGLCSTQQEQDQRELCQRLLQLIDELDYGGEVGREIGEIQQQLLQHNDPETLPPLCLRLIELVIQGSRTERQHSTRFLARLNEGLEGMQDQFSCSVNEGRALVCDRQVHDADLAGELNAIGAHLAGHEQTRLTREIELRMNGIQRILSRHEQLQQREAALLTRLQTLETRVCELKQQASDYRRRLTSQNEKLLIDSLTQVYNRTALNERLKTEFQRWQKSPQPLCITLLDIDHFKQINDKFGHLAGDKALRLIARTLRQSVKASDFVARFGGEEFVVLMLNVDPQLLHRPLEQLCRKIAAIPFRFKQERVTITVSMGATLLRHGDTITSALERADQALYRAKNAGRNQLVIL